jgi:hypothetical protein
MIVQLQYDFMLALHRHTDYDEGFYSRGPDGFEMGMDSFASSLIIR